MARPGDSSSGPGSRNCRCRARNCSDRLVRQIAGGEDVRQRRAGQLRRCAGSWPGASSRNVRCRPPSLQNGCSALTTPAPCVQRLPDAGGQRDHGDFAIAQAPPAQRRAIRRSAAAWRRSRRPAGHPRCSVLAGRRFCARPMRPFFKSARICSCCSRSKPFCSSNSRQALLPAAVRCQRGSSRSNSVCTMPRNSGLRAAGGAERVQFRAAQRRQRPRIRPQPAAARCSA